MVSLIDFPMADQEQWIWGELHQRLQIGCTSCIIREHWLSVSRFVLLCSKSSYNAIAMHLIIIPPVSFSPLQ